MNDGSIVVVRNVTRDSTLGERVRVARGFLSRGRGLMLQCSLDPHDGLLIDPCSSIHTMWMRFPIDVVYVNDQHEVVRADGAMNPWKIGPVFTGARFVVELPAGAIERSRTRSGDTLWIGSASNTESFITNERQSADS